MQAHTTTGPHMHADPIVRQLHAHLRREDQAQQAYERAHCELFHQIVSALTEDPTREVDCPGYNPKTWAAYKIVDDRLCGAPELWVDLLRIVGRASKSRDPATRLEAQAWISQIAGHHADYHAQDLVDVEAA